VLVLAVVACASGCQIARPVGAFDCTTIEHRWFDYGGQRIGIPVASNGTIIGERDRRVPIGLLDIPPPPAYGIQLTAVGYFWRTRAYPSIDIFARMVAIAAQDGPPGWLSFDDNPGVVTISSSETLWTLRRPDLTIDGPTPMVATILRTNLDDVVGLEIVFAYERKYFASHPEREREVQQCFDALVKQAIVRRQ